MRSSILAPALVPHLQIPHLSVIHVTDKKSPEISLFVLAKDRSEKDPEKVPSPWTLC